MVAWLVAWTLTTWTALTAAGTIGAVLAALFLDELRVLRQRRREPRLTLVHSVDDSAIEVTYRPKSVASVAVSGRAAYLRFAVSNERGRDAARDVEVLLQRAERLHGHDGHVMGRVHVASPPFEWSNVETTTLTIPAGVTRVIDVGIVDGPPDPEFQHQRSSATKPPQLSLRLGIVPAPADGRHVLPPGRYRLDLVVTARNTDAQHYEAFSGLWPEDEAKIWERVRVTQPPTRLP